MILEVTLTGHIEKVLYEHPESGFAVFSFVSDEVGPMVAVGHLPGTVPGQPLRLIGAWEHHKSHGKRFRFSSAAALRPTSNDATIRFLGSGLIPGIGPKLAERIVNHFGESTLDLLDDNIDRLREVSGIGPNNFKKIKKAWESSKQGREVAMVCQELGISTIFAKALAKEYGANAESIIRGNPYRLALEIKGIGFTTADQIAQNLGIDRSHPARGEAGLVHMLEDAGNDGNVALPERVLIERTSNLLSIPSKPLYDALQRTVDKGHLVIDDSLENEPYIYTPISRLIEQRLACSLIALLKTPGTVREIDADKAVEWVEKRLDLKLADAQAKAVTEAVRSKVMVVTGGPGTGKTTIIRAILEILGALDKTIALAAPTGRAAKRMTEATGQEAFTIHRLLKWIPAKNNFEHGPDHPLETEVVIVDEASMLDQWITQRLLGAIHPAAKLILVGDVDQLPSVGPGNVLCDIIRSQRIPTIELTEIYRQDKAGLIVKNAHRINSGKKPELPKSGEVSDFYFITENDPDKLRELVCDLVTRRLPEKFGLDPMNDIQVLAPMHRGEAGVARLNTDLQERLNPDGREMQRRGQRFRVGDKVMQTINDYDLDVFNGDIGRIVDMVDGAIKVQFDKDAKIYEHEKLNDLVPAYALSVHKSQGSEYPAVVLPLSTQHFILLQRNLLYTAVTRARKLVVLCGSWTALFQALKNNRPSYRYTGLTNRLKRENGDCLL